MAPLRYPRGYSPGLAPIKTVMLSSEEKEKEKEKVEEEALSEPLSPGSRVFLQPKMNCCVMTAFGSETAIDVEAIKEGLKQTLLKHPRFSSKLQVMKGGETRWVRTQVKLDEHIIIPNLDQLDMDLFSKNQPGSVSGFGFGFGSGSSSISISSSSSTINVAARGDQFVEDYLSMLTTVPLDMTKPVWELHLLNIKTSDAKGIGVFRIHHSLGDGISLISNLFACTRKTSDPNSLPTLPTAAKKNKSNIINNNKKNKRRRRRSSSSSSSSIYILQLVEESLFAAKLVWYNTLQIAHFLTTMLFLRDTYSNRHHFLGGTSKCSHQYENNPPGYSHSYSYRKFAHRIISLDDIKLVKNEMNVTINDVMTGLLQAALSRYLNRKCVQEGPTQKLVNNIIPRRLRACLVMNIRPSPGIQELANMMEKGSKCRWGNAIGFVILPFNIGVRNDPLDYIRQAKATIDRKKQSHEAKLTYACALLVHKLFGDKVVAALSHRILAHTTMSFSNLVGPVDEISFYGHPIAYIATTVYGNPQALTIHSQSLANKMTIVVSVDETAVISDPHLLLDDLEQSLDHIKNIILSAKKKNLLTTN